MFYAVKVENEWIEDNGIAEVDAKMIAIDALLSRGGGVAEIWRVTARGPEDEDDRVAFVCEIRISVVDLAGKIEDSRASKTLSAVADALGTGETGANLVEVARNAHRAEQALAARERSGISLDGAVLYFCDICRTPWAMLPDADGEVADVFGCPNCGGSRCLAVDTCGGTRDAATASGMYDPEG